MSVLLSLFFCFLIPYPVFLGMLSICVCLSVVGMCIVPTCGLAYTELVLHIRTLLNVRGIHYVRCFPTLVTPIVPILPSPCWQFMRPLAAIELQLGSSLALNPNP